jgi:vibriolysin
MFRQCRLLGGLLVPSLFVAACAQGADPAEQGELDGGAAAADLVAVRVTDVQRGALSPSSGRAAGAAANEPLAAAEELVAQRAELRAPRSQWKASWASRDEDGLTHVRMQQFHDGVRVWGGDLVVHSDSAKAADRGLGQSRDLIDGQMVRSLGAFDVTPSIAAASALAAAKADYAKAAKSLIVQLAYAREASELVVLPALAGERGGRTRLAWHVVFFTELQAGIAPALSNYFVDAKTGEIFRKWNGIHTLAQASGPGGNAKVARTWTAALDVEQSGAGYIMDTARLTTVDMDQGTSGGTVVSGPLTNIGDAAINDAHGFAEVALNMLTDWGGYNSIDDAGFKIVSRVHYATNYENAFWDGAQMTYGDGATTFYPLSGDVDVVAHEIHHGFTTFHSNLVYSGQSGGMNESFSDIMGTAAEFYAEGLGADWDVGRDIFKGNTALRFMCNPTQDGRSIDNLLDYVEGIDVHYSSGIMNKAFCRAARRLASGSPTGDATVASVRKLAKAFYVANASYWTPNSTFVQGCQGTLDATAALGWSAAERDALRTSWSESGVYCDGMVEPIVCDETLTAASGVLTSPNHPDPYPNLYRRTWCIQPGNGLVATLHFTAFSTEANYDFVQIRDAAGALLSRTSGTTLPADVAGPILAITFTSDQLETSSGFSAIWTTTPNSPPSVVITAPAAGSSVSGVVAITAEASDDGSVARVKFELPDGSVSTDTTAPYGVSWRSSNVVDGASHVIKATAYDNLGVASSVAQIAVTVANGQGCIQQRFSAAGLPRAISTAFGFYTRAKVTGPGNVESLKLSLTILTPSQGEVRVTLTSPSGTSYRVHDRTGGSTDDLFLVDVPITVFNRETAAGDWTMEVSDSSGRGTLYAWSLYVVGTCGPAGYWWASGKPNLPLVNNGRACTTLSVADDGDAATAKLTISGTHSSRVSLRGTLAHNGIVATAFPLETFSWYNGPFYFVNRPVPGLSGSALGEWTLCIIDNDTYPDRGTLYNWAIHE